MSNQQKSHHQSRNANEAVLEVFFKDIYNAKDLMESCLTKGEKALFSLFFIFSSKQFCEINTCFDKITVNQFHENFFKSYSV